MASTSGSPTVAIIVGAIFVVVIVAVVVMAIRRREIVFDGEVIDKNIVENRNNVPINNMGNMNQGGINMISNGGIQHEYFIKVKTATGKTIKYKISSGMYEVVKIGDTVSKPKGTTEITITSSKTPTANVATPQVVAPATPPSAVTPPITTPATPPTDTSKTSPTGVS